MATIVGSSVLAANCAARTEAEVAGEDGAADEGAIDICVGIPRRRSHRIQQEVVDPKRDVQHLQRCGQVDPVP